MFETVKKYDIRTNNHEVIHIKNNTVPINFFIYRGLKNPEKLHRVNCKCLFTVMKRNLVLFQKSADVVSQILNIHSLDNKLG